MTSASVKDLSSIMTFVNPANQVKGKGFLQDTGFGDVMTKAESNQTNVDVGSANQKKTDANSFSQHVERNNSKGTRIEEPKKMPDDEIDTSEAMKSLNEAGEEIVKEIADEMNVDEEEVVKAMESLGLSPISLLDSNVLGDLVLEISDESDPMALLTSENLFDSVKSLTTIVDATVADLAKDMDMEVSSLKNLIENADIQSQGLEEMEMSVETNSNSLNIQNNNSDNVANDSKTERASLDMKNINNVNDASVEGDDDTVNDLKINTTNSSSSKEDSDFDTNSNGASDTNSKGANQSEGTKDATWQVGRQENRSVDSHNTENKNAYHESIHFGNEMKNPILDNLVNNSVQGAQNIESYFSEDTRNIMNQIMDYMKVNVKPEMDQLELQLHPASLGTVKINLTATKAGEVTAEFKVQNEQVKAAVEAQLNDLRETFKASGTKVTAIEVQVEMQSFDSNLWQGKGHNTDAESQNRQPKRQRRINVDDLDALFEDEASQEEVLAAQMMRANGNTVDYMA